MGEAQKRKPDIILAKMALSSLVSFKDGSHWFGFADSNKTNGVVMVLLRMAGGSGLGSCMLDPNSNLTQRRRKRHEKLAQRKRGIQ